MGAFGEKGKQLGCRAKNILFLCLAALAVVSLFLPAVAFAASFLDTTQSDFDLGTKSQTSSTADGNIAISTQTATTYYSDGNFTSQVFNAGTISDWQNINWNEGGHYGEQLPDYNTNGNQADANMTGNILLMHLNEGAGNAGAVSRRAGNPCLLRQG